MGATRRNPRFHSWCAQPEEDKELACMRRRTNRVSLPPQQRQTITQSQTGLRAGSSSFTATRAGQSVQASPTTLIVDPLGILAPPTHTYTPSQRPAGGDAFNHRHPREALWPCFLHRLDTQGLPSLHTSHPNTSTPTHGSSPVGYEFAIMACMVRLHCRHLTGEAWPSFPHPCLLFLHTSIPSPHQSPHMAAVTV